MKGIYCIENTTNGKKYIGQSIDVKRRIRRHRFDLRHNKHINKHLQSAWNKYGEGSFRFKVLSICLSDDEMNDLEKELIKEFNTYHEGYNRTMGGESGFTSFLGKKHSKETIEKMRRVKLGKKHTDEHKAKISAKLRTMDIKRVHSEETRKRMSEIAKNRYFSKETRDKISKALKGKKHSEEAKRKMSEARKGKAISDDVKEKISNTKKRKFSEEEESRIRQLIDEGVSYRKIGKMFGCSHMTITRRFK